MNIESVLERFIIDDLIIGVSRNKIDPNESLIANGVIDSLAILQLIAFIEERFGVTIDDSEVTPDNFQTINVMKALIEEKLLEDGRDG